MPKQFEMGGGSPVKKQETLRGNYEIFLKDQLPMIKEKISGYDMVSAEKFIKFILKVLPDVITELPSTPKEDLRAEDLGGVIKKIWEKQASGWAQTETLPNYFINMALIMTWLKKAESTKDMLSVGSGPGLYEIFIEQELKDKVGNFYCTDVSPKMLGQVRDNQRKAKMAFREKSNLKLEVCGIESLPFKDESMDVIIGNKVLHWSTKKRDAVEEMNRVLKPGGLLMLVIPNGQSGIATEDKPILFNEKIDVMQLGAFLHSLSFKALDYKRLEYPAPMGQHKGKIDDFALLFQKEFKK